MITHDGFITESLRRREPLHGIRVWVLLDETPQEVEDVADVGISLIGLFWTKEEALAYLSADQVGEEEARHIEWDSSPYNPEYFEGYNPYTRNIYFLIRYTVGEN